jgi:hypothetical protein
MTETWIWGQYIFRNVGIYPLVQGDQILKSKKRDTFTSDV